MLGASCRLVALSSGRTQLARSPAALLARSRRVAWPQQLHLRPPAGLRRFASVPVDSATKMLNILNAEFPGGTVEVEDTSGGCGSFFQVRVTSPAFTGKSMIKQHRMVQDALKAEIAEMHGLNIVTKAMSKPD